MLLNDMNLIVRENCVTISLREHVNESKLCHINNILTELLGSARFILDCHSYEIMLIESALNIKQILHKFLKTMS